MVWDTSAMAIENGCDASGAMPLRAAITPVNTPAAAGVPLITPELLPSVRPGGSEPVVITNVGAGVPVAAIAKVYGTP